MSLLAVVLIALVALLHLGFLVLEMFLWTRPYGLKVFRQSREKAEQSKVLAANQGLYNGFLAAGLVWAMPGARRMWRCSSSAAWWWPACTARRRSTAASSSYRRCRRWLAIAAVCLV